MADNLTQLCERLRADTKGLTNEQAFDTLKTLLGDGIRFRYELVNENADENADAHNDTHADTQADTHDEILGESADKTRFGHLNSRKISRVVLTTVKSPTTDYSRELVRQCNGVVLQFPEWKVLSVPSPGFNLRYRVNDVKKNLSQYKVYEIKDGSTITLYWYEPTNTWCMSSANGFDVSEYQWLGKSTYADAFNQVAKLYPDFSFDRLDKTRSYTVGFRHPDFHPLATDQSKIWLIQAHDLETLQPTEVAIGIPHQTTLDAIDWDQMMEKNKLAMTKYMTPEQRIHYGYVLRGDCGELSNIILESELLKSIRQMVYDLPKHRIPNAAPITPYTRIEYIALRAYLSATRFTFINLFPQFAAMHKRYDEMCKRLADRIISTIRKRLSFKILTPADRLVAGYADHISKSGVDVLKADGESIVLDFLRDKSNLDLLYSCMIAPAGQAVQDTK